VFLASESDDDQTSANAVSTPAPNQGTTSAPHISHSNASAPLAPLTTPATSNQAGTSAVAVTHIEAVNDPELATPYIPYLIREGENYYTNIWSSHYRPRSFDI
jgi:hypothetical protein